MIMQKPTRTHNLFAGITLLMFALPVILGCGATGINPLPSNETSVYAGTYTATYTGRPTERGTMALNVTNAGTIFGTFNDEIAGKGGPVSGQIRQDGKFKLFYHYNDASKLVYTGDGLFTAPETTLNGTVNITTFNGTLNITTPEVFTLSLALTRQ